MKKIEWSTNTQVRNLEDNNTPFMDIDIVMGDVHANARLYWTKGGAYGPQVQTVLRAEGDSFGEKTSGCGYSKRGHAISNLLGHLKCKPSYWKDGSDNLYEYHVGGNYYKIEG